MRNFIYTVLVAVLMSSCAGFQPVKLTSRVDKPTYKIGNDKGVILKDTVLFDFAGSIDSWWRDPKYAITRVGNTIKVKVNEVGPDYQPFGTSFDPLNFTQAPFLKVKMRLEEGTTDFPIIRIDIKDVNGVTTNTSPASVVLDSAGWKLYYFSFFKNFKQSYPEPAEVDPTKIAGIQFFINPGGKPWSGTFYVDDICTTVNPDGSGILPTDYVLDNFGGGLEFWPCNPQKVKLSKFEGDKMRVDYKGAQWDCLGKVYGEMDVTETPVIRIKARFISENPEVKTDLLVRFADKDENQTDLIDGQIRKQVEMNGDFKYYYFVYKDENGDFLKSQDGKFNPKVVPRIMVFVNTDNQEPFYGTMIVDDITYMKSYPNK